MRKSERKPDAASAVGDFLSSAYQRVPQLPYLDRATSLILIVCVAGYLGFTAYVFFTEPPVQIEAKLLEDTAIRVRLSHANLPGDFAGRCTAQ
jgi:hypothetical protein